MLDTRRNAPDDDALAIRIIALLNDNQVLAKMKTMLYPHELAEKINALTQKVESLNFLLAIKDANIDELEKRWISWTRRPTAKSNTPGVQIFVSKDDQRRPKEAPTRTYCNW